MSAPCVSRFLAFPGDCAKWLFETNLKSVSNMLCIDKDTDFHWFDIIFVFFSEVVIFGVKRFLLNHFC